MNIEYTIQVDYWFIMSMLFVILHALRYLDALAK
jgi:hypothetical protein